MPLVRYQREREPSEKQFEVNIHASLEATFPVLMVSVVCTLEVVSGSNMDLGFAYLLNLFCVVLLGVDQSIQATL